MIERRVESGLLVVEYPGVYRIGPPRIEARYMAAVFACGDGAGLSGPAAAWLWSVIRRSPPEPEVSAPKKVRIAGLKTATANYTQARSPGTAASRSRRWR